MNKRITVTLTEDQIRFVDDLLFSYVTDNVVRQGQARINFGRRIRSELYNAHKKALTRQRWLEKDTAKS